MLTSLLATTGILQGGVRYDAILKGCNLSIPKLSIHF